MDIVSQCATCRFWKRSEGFDAEYHGPHSGECSSPKFVYGGETWGDAFRTPKDGLEYWDSESYAAGFKTGEDFGCVHHELQQRGA